MLLSKPTLLLVLACAILVEVLTVGQDPIETAQQSFRRGLVLRQNPSVASCIQQHSTYELKIKFSAVSGLVRTLPQHINDPNQLQQLRKPASFEVVTSDVKVLNIGGIGFKINKLKLVP